MDGFNALKEAFEGLKEFWAKHPRPAPIQCRNSSDSWSLVTSPIGATDLDTNPDTLSSNENKLKTVWVAIRGLLRKAGSQQVNRSTSLANKLESGSGVKDSGLQPSPNESEKEALDADGEPQIPKGLVLP